MTEELYHNLRAIILEHLGRLEQYRPAHGRGSDRLSAAELQQTFSDDPMYSIFGLDSSEYIAAALAGGTITSIHRKIGDAYEDCVRAIFQARYHLSADQVQYAAVIASGDRQSRRSLDLRLSLNDIPEAQRENWASYARDCLKRITPAPKVEITAIGLEIRHCYQSADAKRVQADEAMARHCIVSGILPVMLIFCAQSNRNVINRYRSLWIVVEGLESYALIKAHTGFDFYAFLLAHREEFRHSVLRALAKLREAT